MTRDGGRLCPVSLAAMLAGLVAVLLVLEGCSARFTGKTVSAAGEASGCLEAHLDAVELRQLSPGAAGSGRVQVVSDTGRGRASFDFVFRRPDSLRIQFVSPLGPAAAVLDLSGDRYLFADFREGVFLSGQPGDERFHRLTGLPLVMPHTLISILLAEPTLENSEVGLLRFQAGTCLPLSCELNGRTAEPMVSVDFLWPSDAADRWQDPGLLSLPDRVILTGPDPGHQTTIRFKNVRPLTDAERRQALDPVDITGLRRAVPGGSDEAGLTRWFQ